MRHEKHFSNPRSADIAYWRLCYITIQDRIKTRDARHIWIR
jgi:hypothetical protein